MNDLFPDAPIPADPLGGLDDAEIIRRWPKSLAEMSDVAIDALQRDGLDEPAATRQALVVLAALSRYHGGRMFYLPTGDSLERAIRDNRLWKAYDGKPETVTRLAREESLTEVAVYRVLAEQRALHVAKVQSKLF